MPRILHGYDCAILGAGCSGTLTAFHLARLSHAHMAEADGGVSGIEFSRRFSCAIVDPGAAGPGLPYRTQHPRHVLNVPAGRMSAAEAEPSHFVEWCRSSASNAIVAGGDFMPRRVFGSYLTSLAAESAKRLKLYHVQSRAIGLQLTDAGIKITCENGHSLDAKHVVLAWGHGAPRTPGGVDVSAQAHTGFVSNPWTVEFSPARLARGVMFIGTGLTMLDCAMTVADRAPECRMLAVSRRGLLPQPHRYHDVPPLNLPPPPIAYWPTTTRGIVRAVRAYVRSCRNRGWDWREAITALRPVTSQLWSGLSLKDKQRFLARLVPYWDAHRHRAAPQVSARTEQLRSSGNLDVVAARIVNVTAAGEDLKVTLLMRSTQQERTLTFGYVVNCTGPETDLHTVDNPLVSNLLSEGLLLGDELRLGLQADAEGHPINASGMAIENIWTIGPLRKAQLWETTAVPEIRVQAENIAKKIYAAIA